VQLLKVKVPLICLGTQGLSPRREGRYYSHSFFPLKISLEVALDINIPNEKRFEHQSLANFRLPIPCLCTIQTQSFTSTFSENKPYLAYQNGGETHHRDRRKPKLIARPGERWRTWSEDLKHVNQQLLHYLLLKCVRTYTIDSMCNTTIKNIVR